MKNYKEFKKIYIGESDIASLILAGCDENGLVTKKLNFGEDGNYSAYLIECSNVEDVEIGNHYVLIAKFNHWLRIYDDNEKTFDEKAKEFYIYRAGEYGCIIQKINN